MKLIFCTRCRDVVRLWEGVWRSCDCGESHGVYLLGCLKAKIKGPAVPLGFANRSFARALSERPDEGLGSRFTAFVIPRECDTVEEDA